MLFIIFEMLTLLVSGSSKFLLLQCLPVSGKTPSHVENLSGELSIPKWYNFPTSFEGDLC